MSGGRHGASSPSPFAIGSSLSLSLLLSLLPPLSSATHLCFEQVSNIPGIFLQEHPAGGKLVVATQDGMIQLLTLPAVGSGKTAAVTGTYLDLMGRVHFKGEQGLLSFAFHPKFLENGRFFVSYVCDSSEQPNCQGKCAVSVITGNHNANPVCPRNTIVAEYSAGPSPGQAPLILPQEVRQILRFGRPYDNHNGGNIWFGSDGYLYYTSGDGGNQGDPLSTAQNGNIPLGKIMRLDVDGPATQTDWGSYRIPADNPFVGVPGVLPEVYALGFRNPWRCSEDVTMNVTLCGDVGQNTAEEVDMILKGGNYGWSIFEAVHNFKPRRTLEAPVGGQFLAPELYYDHPEVENGQAVIGGHVYRADRNPCLKGKYIYGDEFGALYVGSIYQPNSTYESATYSIAPTGGHATVVKAPIKPTPYASAQNSDPNGSSQNISTPQNTPFPDGDHLFSWGVDNANELYRLSSSGIFRVTESSFCGDVCESDGGVETLPPAPSAMVPSASSPSLKARETASLLTSLRFVLLVFAFLPLAV